MKYPRSRIFILFMLILGLNCYGQSEKIFSFGDHALPYSADLLGNKLIIGVNDRAGLIGPNFSACIYALDQDLNILDSINTQALYGLHNNIVSSIVNIGDTMVAALVTATLFDTAFTSHSELLLIDNQLNVIKNIPLEFQDTLNIFESLAKTDDSLLWILGHEEVLDSSMTSGIGHFPIILIYDLKAETLIGHYRYPQVNTDSPRNTFLEISQFQGNYFTYEAFPFTSNRLYELDQNYNLKNIYTSSDIGIAHIRPYKSLTTNTNGLYASGFTSGTSVGLLKFNAGLMVEIIDSFNVSSGRDVFNQVGCTDLNSLDSIFMISGEGDLNDFELENARAFGIDFEFGIHVYNLDTAANLNWYTYITQDSTYLRPHEVVASPDGGAFIISAKYDRTFKKEAHKRVSVIKIDRNGNYITEQEFGTPVQQISLYPNPVKHGGTMRLEGISRTDLIQAFLYNSKGQLLQKYSLTGSKKLSMHGIPSGHYYLSLKANNGKFLQGNIIVILSE